MSRVRYNPRPVKRLARILLHAVTVLSFLLLVATLTGWVRGYRAREYFGVVRENTTDGGWVCREWAVDWGGGDIGVVYAPASADAAAAREAGCPAGVRWGGRSNRWAPTRATSASVAWTALWMRAGHRAEFRSAAGIMAGRAQGRDWASSLSVPAGVPRSDRRYYWLILPCWMAAILFAVLPAQRTWAMVRHRRVARRAKAGLCPACGYDLRATPDRCPECGAVPSCEAPRRQ